MRRIIGAAALAALIGACYALGVAQDAGRAEPRWWKGNTHTHTLWSDGNGAPELVADWYKSRGYEFLVLSDHNTLSVGERWFPIAEDDAQEGDRRLTRARVAELVERFGADAVELRDEPEPAMRLATLDEVRARFEEPGRFLMIQGEEITGPVHVNGINLSERIAPEFDGSIAATTQEYLDRVKADGEAAGRPTAAHLNHPNYAWAVEPTDLLQLEGSFAFEVYNGHPSVNNAGNAEHASTEQMWDLALTLRLGALGRETVFGVATDDSHHYFREDPRAATPGRGWIMVRATELTADTITAAIANGDFYSTTGVELEDVSVEDDVLALHIRTREGEEVTTEFLGTLSGSDGVDGVGDVLFTTSANPARYTFRGDELYVRARVTSSLPLAVPDADGSPQRAWTQPVVP